MGEVSELEAADARRECSPQRECGRVRVAPGTVPGPVGGSWSEQFGSEAGVRGEQRISEARGACKRNVMGLLPFKDNSGVI